MKAKANAKQKREADTLKRKGLWSPKKDIPAEETVLPPPPKPEIPKTESLLQQTPEEETRLFLEYLEKHDRPMQKDDTPPAKRKPKAGNRTGILNLEDGMPTAEEAISRLRIGIQEMKAGRIKAVKLIHGYGSTGRGGKIRTAVRKELADMKRKRQILDLIPGEDFGPLDEASRKAAEQEKGITKDPDYGRMNHGITIVLL